MALNQRPKGLVVYKSPVNQNALAAKQRLKDKADRLAADRARKAATPVPNRICYAETAFKNWKSGDKIPTCNLCDGILHRNENHVCAGYTPKYVEHDDAWKERQAARREAIRESNLREPIRCSGCDTEIEDGEDAMWHEENCGNENRPQRRAIRGDEDDLSGYEDEPEDDFCDGDGDPELE